MEAEAEKEEADVSLDRVLMDWVSDEFEVSVTTGIMVRR